MRFPTPAIVWPRSCVMVRQQAEGEIYSFEPDASELTGAGADATEVGQHCARLHPKGV